MAEQIYRYRAFISYRHVERDRKWARWLVEKLETYRTPRALVRAGAPARIGRLFRDDDEVPASADLTHQVEDALRASQFLIVVCSRDTPASIWVRQEIDFFRALGRGDRILVLLVDGEPSQAFPSNLVLRRDAHEMHKNGEAIDRMEVEPIASDVRPRHDERRSSTERRAFLRLAAGLLGVSYDDLVQRDRARRARIRRSWSAIAAMLLIVAGGGGYEYWDYNRVKLHYYADIETRWGVPFGVGELSFEAASHRNASYEIATRQGLVISTKRVNGSGGLGDIGDTVSDIGIRGASVAEFRMPYPSVRANEIDLYDDRGYLLRIERFAFQPDGHTAIVSLTDTAGNAQVLDAFNPGPVRNKSTIAQYKLTFDANGQVAQREYQTVWGAAVSDLSGTLGQRYTFYPNGHIKTVRNLLKGGPASSYREREYSPQGDLTVMTTRDAKGRPIADATGVAMRRSDRDAYGNEVLLSFFDAAAAAVVASDNKAAEVRKTYDARGNLVRQDYLDVLGRLTTYGDEPYARIVLEYDGAGRVVSRAYFDRSGRPTITVGTNEFLYLYRHRMTTRYDARGNVIEYRYFESDDKPFPPSSGVQRVTYTYDPAGHQLLERFWNSAGLLAPLPGLGVAGTDIGYDQRGRQTSTTTIGTDGRPANIPEQGFSRMEVRFDDQGNFAEIDLFGPDGKPAMNLRQHFSLVKMQYDAHGHLVERDFFGTSYEPILNADGYASQKLEYDDAGNEVAESFFGADGRPVIHNASDVASSVVPDADWRRVDFSGVREGGYARKTQRYARGQVVQTDYFGTDGKPIVAHYSRLDLSNALHGARITHAYDGGGRETEIALFGVDGKPMLDPAWGAARRTMKFDGQGRRIEEAYFGADSKPVLVPQFKAARVVYKYNNAGVMTEADLFGLDGTLQRAERNLSVH